MTQGSIKNPCKQTRQIEPKSKPNNFQEAKGQGQQPGQEKEKKTKKQITLHIKHHS